MVSTAIYLPQHDIWAEMPIADTHMCMKLNERLETACVDGIHKAGYWFDYVNDDVLMNWECYGYDTLLLIECDRIPVAVMKKIQEICRQWKNCDCGGKTSGEILRTFKLYTKYRRNQGNRGEAESERECDHYER
mgnify:CR=1 FL=1